MEDNSLSLCMIVKNEGKHLYKCLESVSSIVDEIIIVDTGSTDNTIRIAEEFNSRIFHFNWINDFSAARNYALTQCSGKWILYLDADEQITENSLNELSALKSGDEKIGYKCIVNSVNTRGGKSNIMTYTRLFYNSAEIKFYGKVHEQIDESLLKSGYRIINSQIEISHYGYDLDEDDLKKKAVRNLDMLLLEYQESKSSYYAYQLANTYNILEDNSRANEYYIKALKDELLFKEYKGIAYMNLADAELKNQNILSAIDLVNKGIAADGNNPMLYMLASQIYLRQEKFNEAIHSCNLALSVNNSSDKSSVLKIGMSKETILFQCLLCSTLNKDEDRFNEFLCQLKCNIPLYQLIENLISGEPFEFNKFRSLINEDNLTLFLTLLAKHSDNNFVLEFLLSIKYRFSENARYLSNLGKAYMENNLFYEAALVLENSLLLKQKDPTVVFYLISVYLMINKLDRVAEIITLGEKEFGSIPEFVSQLQKLKEKVKPILKNSKEKEIH